MTARLPDEELRDEGGGELIPLLQPREQTYLINAMWGWLDEHGRWHPNPHLDMTADEQWADNRRRGWPCP